MPTGTPYGLTTVGYSIGLDRQLAEDVLIRVEGRIFHGVDDLYESMHGPVPYNTRLTLGMGVRL